MTLLQDLESIQARRQYPNWQPIRPNATSTPRGDKWDEVLKRCVEFLPLELQVAQWDEEASEVIEEAAPILARNANDEAKHDEVLKYLAEYMGVYGSSYRATSIINGWKASEANPLVLTYALECGVFFSILPTLGIYGDVYASLVKQWIADDERVHVETGLRLMKELKLKVTDGGHEVLKLVHDTNVYLFTPLGATEAFKRAERAIRRCLTGKDKEMLNESLPATVANFEQVDRGSIAYY